LKKVLYISYDGLTDPLGQSQVLPYVTYLSRNGYRFTILSFEKKERFNKERHIIEAIANNSNIHWVPLTFTAKPPVLSKIYDRYRMWRTALSLYRNEKFDLIHCRSYIAAEMGLRLKKKFGVKMLFDMRGFWADEKVDNGQWNIQKPFYRRLYQHYKKKEKEFLLAADGIVSLTKAAKNYLLEQPQYKHLSIEVIPCCADLDHFDYHKISLEEANALCSSLGIDTNSKVMIYLGSTGGWYMTKEMLLFFKALLEAYPHYVMLVLTKDDADKLRKEAADLGIAGNQLVITYSDRKRLPQFMALANFSIFFIRNSFSKMASSPTKHAELMGMGIPVVCNDIGDTGNIIAETKTGMVVNEFDKTSLNRAVKKIEELEQLSKEHIRNCAARYFDLQNGGKKYLDLYTSLTAKNSNSNETD
jgi:glycosyltransferase involved in cell wall biosynthesis